MFPGISQITVFDKLTAGGSVHRQPHMGAVGFLNEGGLSQPATPHSGLHGSALSPAHSAIYYRKHGITWNKLNSDYQGAGYPVSTGRLNITRLFWRE